eukprot:10904613-Lingulodinium_polyedra.AAC.1
MAWTCSSACCPIAARRLSMTGPNSPPNSHGPAPEGSKLGPGTGAIGSGGGGGGTPAAVSASSA